MWLGNFPERNGLKSRIITQKTWVSQSNNVLTRSVFGVIIFYFNPFLAGKWPCHIKAKVKSFRNWCLIFFFRLKFPLLGAFVWTQKSFRNISKSEPLESQKNPVLLVSKKKNMSCCMNYVSLSAKKQEVNRAKFLIRTSVIKTVFFDLTVDFIVAINSSIVSQKPTKMCQNLSVGFKFTQQTSIQLEDFVKFLWLL